MPGRGLNAVIVLAHESLDKLPRVAYLAMHRIVNLAVTTMTPRARVTVPFVVDSLQGE